VGQVIPVLLNLGFWFTPIVYMPSVIPETYRDLLALNPIYPLVTAYQNILVFGTEPPLLDLAWVMGIAAGLLGVALFMFRRASPEMVDAL
jgi:lipopolysaccharide transport system permease protein